MDMEDPEAEAILKRIDVHPPLLPRMRLYPMATEDLGLEAIAAFPDYHWQRQYGSQLYRFSVLLEYFELTSSTIEACHYKRRKHMHLIPADRDGYP